MKPHVRVLGIDDAPFRFSDKTVPVVGVVIRAPSYVEGVMVTEVEVDGEDATERLSGMLSRSRYRAGLSLVLIDGVALGGFNVVDIEEIHRRTGVPVATVTKKVPDFAAMEATLRRKFTDHARRWEVIRRGNLDEVTTSHRSLRVRYVGTTLEHVKGVIALTTVRGALPEPLRVAHLMATALVKGESRGRA